MIAHAAVTVNYLSGQVVRIITELAEIRCVMDFPWPGEVHQTRYFPYVLLSEEASGDGLTTL